MTTGGWIFMLVSVGSVYGLVVWCFHRVLTARPPDASAEEPTRRR